jgi:hypothetical protein
MSGVQGRPTAAKAFVIVTATIIQKLFEVLKQRDSNRHVSIGDLQDTLSTERTYVILADIIAQKLCNMR